MSASKVNSNRSFSTTHTQTMTPTHSHTFYSNTHKHPLLHTHTLFPLHTISLHHNPCSFKHSKTCTHTHTHTHIQTLFLFHPLTHTHTQTQTHLQAHTAMPPVLLVGLKMKLKHPFKGVIFQTLTPINFNPRTKNPTGKNSSFFPSFDRVLSRWKNV